MPEEEETKAEETKMPEDEMAKEEIEKEKREAKPEQSKPNPKSMAWLLLLAFVFLVYPFAAIWFSSRMGGPGTLSKNNVPNIELKNFIQQVKAELLATEEESRAKNEPVTLTLKNIDLEINFVVKRKAQAGGEASLEVVTLSNAAEAADERTHKVTLHMEAGGTHKGQGGSARSQGRDLVKLS